MQIAKKDFNPNESKVEIIRIGSLKKKFVESTTLVVAGCHSHMLSSEHYTYFNKSILLFCYFQFIE